MNWSNSVVFEIAFKHCISNSFVDSEDYSISSRGFLATVVYCMLSPCLLNLYAECIIQNAKLDEYKLESRLPGEIPTTSDMQMMTNPMAESEEELKGLLRRVKKESEKAGLKLNIKKSKIMATRPITYMQIEGKRWKQWQISSSWALKSLWMVTAAMKLEDNCILAGKLWQT